jgi:hypothetical protein
MSDIQPHLTEKGAALLKARVVAETKELGPELQKAKNTVEMAAKAMAQSGSEAGKGFADNWSSAIQAELPRALGRVALGGGGFQMALGMDEMWAEIPTRIAESWEGKFAPLGLQTGKEIAEAAEQALAVESEKWATAIQGGFGDMWPKALKLDEGVRQLSMDWAQVPGQMEGASAEGFTELGLKSARQIRESFLQEMKAFANQPPVFAEGFADKMKFGAKDIFGWRHATKEAGDAGIASAGAFADGFGRGVEMHMPRAMRLLVGGHIAAAVIDIGKSALKAGTDLAKFGAEAEGVMLGFETMATPPSVEFLDKMRAAVNNTVPDLELMRNANRDLMMGIVQDEKVVIDLLEVSYTMARTRGLGVTEFYTRMTNAIASLHPTTLRSLGIMIDSKKVYADTAQALGKATSALTDHEKRLAMVNAIINNEHLEAVRTVMTETTLMSDKIEQATTAKDNFRMATGLVVAELLVESNVLGNLTGLFEGLTDVIQRTTSPKEGMKMLESAYSLSAEQVHEYKAALGALQLEEMAGNITREEAAARYRELNKEIEAAIALSTSSEDALFAWASAAYDVDEAARVAAAGVARLNHQMMLMRANVGMDPSLQFRAQYGYGPQKYDPVKRDEDALKDFIAMASARKEYHRGLLDTAGTVEALQSDLSKYNEGQAEYWKILSQIGKLEEGMAKEREATATKNLDAHQRLERFRMSELELIRDLQREQKQYNRDSAEWADLQLQIEKGEQRIAKEAESAAKSRSKSMADLAREMEKTRAEMESLVKAQIKLTSVSREDTLATELGIYEDKPDEYIRRLRSAVQDEKSLWKDLLEGRSGAEAELFLIRQERAFASGAWHELGPGFDRAAAIEGIIENVRAELEAQRHMESLISEIMTRPELAGFDRRSIERAVGLPEDYQRTGTDNVRAFAAGLEEGVPVSITKLNDAFENEFRQQEERWFVMGELSVLWFTKGIEAGQHQRAVDALVGLIAPRIAERLQGRP